MIGAAYYVSELGDSEVSNLEELTIMFVVGWRLPRPAIQLRSLPKLTDQPTHQQGSAS